MTTPSPIEALPPLPEPAHRTSTTGGAFDHEQMRAYALSAIALAAPTAEPPPHLSEAESADDLTYLKSRVQYWEKNLLEHYEQAGVKPLICCVVSILANRDSADRWLRAPTAEPAQPVAHCDWHADDDGLWQMACGGDPWVFEEGGVVENRVKHCMHCGKPVRLAAKAAQP